MSKDKRNNSAKRNPDLSDMNYQLNAWLIKTGIPASHIILMSIIEQNEGKNGCILSNKKLAELINKSVPRVQQILRKLEKENIIILKNKASKYRQIFTNKKSNLEKLVKK